MDALFLAVRPFLRDSGRKLGHRSGTRREKRIIKQKRRALFKDVANECLAVISDTCHRNEDNEPREMAKWKYNKTRPIRTHY